MPITSQDVGSPWFTVPQVPLLGAARTRSLKSACAKNDYLLSAAHLAVGTSRLAFRRLCEGCSAEFLL